MKLHIFSPDFIRVGDLTNYISLVWMENYQDVGAITIVADDSPDNIEMLRQGNIVYQKGKDVAMVIWYVKYETKEKKITANGCTTLDLLDKRVIESTEYVNNAEQGMKNIVKNNLRELSNIIVADSAELVEIFDTQVSDNLIAGLRKIAVETGLGIKMLFDRRNKRHIFTVYKGKDLTYSKNKQNSVIFSDEFRNLENMAIVDDISVFANVAYVRGAGEGDQRKLVIVGDAKGDDRFELNVDARDIQPNEKEGETAESESYINRLRDRGITKLNEHIHVKTFTAEVNPNHFRTRYNLGDGITCKSTKYGVTINTRIMAYREVTEKNITKLSLTLGNPEINVIEELRINAAI